MRRLFFLAVSIVLLITVIILLEQGDSPIGKIPDWLHGTLLISTMGSDRKLTGMQDPKQQYVCAYDFNDDKFSSVPVTSDGKMIQDTNNLRVYVLERNNGGNRYEMDPPWFVTRIGDWRYDYNFREIEWNNQRTCIALRHESERNPERGTIKLFTPSLALAAVCNNECYYWKYAAAEEGRIVVQLAKQSDLTYGEEEILVSNEHGSLIDHIAVSEHGNLAWIQEDELEERDVNFEKYKRRICALAAQGYVECPDDSVTCPTVPGANTGLCWIDDTTLVYMAMISRYAYNGDIDRFTLRLWHTDTGVTEDIGIEQSSLSFSTWPTVMAYSPRNRVLAVFFPRSIFRLGDWNLDYLSTDHIVFINMETSDQFVFMPWPEKSTDPEILYGSFLQDNKGIYYYEPGYEIDAQMVWLPEN